MSYFINLKIHNIVLYYLKYFVHKIKVFFINSYIIFISNHYFLLKIEISINIFIELVTYNYYLWYNNG